MHSPFFAAKISFFLWKNSLHSLNQIIIFCITCYTIENFLRSKHQRIHSEFQNSTYTLLKGIEMLIQWKPFNVIGLEPKETDDVNQMITISKPTTYIK
jgi:hypothetical protein